LNVEHKIMSADEMRRRSRRRRSRRRRRKRPLQYSTQR